MSVGTKKIHAFDIFNVILLGIFSLMILYPFIYILAVSLSDKLSIMQNKVYFLPKGLNVKAYKMVMEDLMFLGAYANSIFYTAAGTAINIAATALTAYPLSKKFLKGRRAVLIAIIFTMIFTGGIIPNYILIKKLGMIDTVWSLILPGAIWVWNLILMKTFFEESPERMEESAKIDGGNDFQILWRIVTPVSAPIISTMVLFYAVGHWNSFFIPLIYLNKPAMYPLQILLRNIVIAGELNVENPLATGGEVLLGQSIKYATIIISIIPMIILYPLIQKYLIKGILVGSIKG